MALKLRKSAVREQAEMCPIGACMDLIGGQWTPNIIWYLSSGARRFSELREDVKPISAKMLSTRLKEMEAAGIVDRRVVDTSPPSVEYSLTLLGRELIPAIESIARVGYKLKHAQARKRMSVAR